MKKILTFLFIMAIISPVLAVPQFLNYQGVLRDDQARLVTGNKAMTFKLYDALSGGTLIWQLTTPEVTVSNGLYNIKLGPLGYNELGAGPRWLEVSIGSETLAPRLELLSIAYAINAGSSETAGTLAGYSPAATGSGSFIPVTTGGKLDSSVIPASGSVANADAVDGFSASATATAGQILPLDSNKQLKGLSVSAEASSGYAFFVAGKFGASSGGAGSPSGIATITAGNNSVTVNNSYVTATSLILLTQGPYSANIDINTNGVYIRSQSNGQFVVKTNDNTFSVGGSQTLPIYYLIIN
ncbi:MAG: hypothetical protein WCW67_05005 [Candidatus Margulisiibacteriota bacterium]|jgi:hypothetical protein